MVCVSVFVASHCGLCPLVRANTSSAFGLRPRVSLVFSGKLLGDNDDNGSDPNETPLRGREMVHRKQKGASDAYLCLLACAYALLRVALLAETQT